MKTKWIMLLGGVALLVGLVWLAPFRYYPHEGPRAIAARTRKALPIGSDKKIVLSYLNAQKIENSGYLPDTRRIYAIRRNTCVSLFVTCNVDMVFSFSDSGALLEASIAEGLTGL